MAKKKKKEKKIAKKLFHQYRLVVLNEDTFEERFAIKLTRLNVFVLTSISAILLVFFTTLLIAFTPLREYIPGYSSARLKKEASLLNYKTDSLQQVIVANEKYLESIKRVLTGDIAAIEINKDSIINAAELDITDLNQKDSFKVLFAENAGIVFQAKDKSIETILKDANIEFFNIGKVTSSDVLSIINQSEVFTMTVSRLRDVWYKTSYLLDQKQTANNLATDRFNNFKHQPLEYNFPEHFTGKLPKINSGQPKPKAAILREKGSNSEREMANAMFLAGFDVKDVHMTDLISGRENLEDIQFLGAVGGFSNSDVLGSAKGWAGAIKYNEKANKAIQNFFNREDTLSVGICNGCQLFMELEEINIPLGNLIKNLYNKFFDNYIF